MLRPVHCLVHLLLRSCWFAQLTLPPCTMLAGAAGMQIAEQVGQIHEAAKNLPANMANSQRAQCQNTAAIALIKLIKLSWLLHHWQAGACWTLALHCSMWFWQWMQGQNVQFQQWSAHLHSILHEQAEKIKFRKQFKSSGVWITTFNDWAMTVFRERGITWGSNCLSSRPAHIHQSSPPNPTHYRSVESINFLLWSLY